MSDQQLTELRDGLYDLARVAIGAYSQPRSAVSFQELPETDRADVEERAAIAEFEGNLTRDQAERLALDAYLQSKSRH